MHGPLLKSGDSGLDDGIGYAMLSKSVTADIQRVWPRSDRKLAPMRLLPPRTLLKSIAEGRSMVERRDRLTGGKIRRKKRKKSKQLAPSGLFCRQQRRGTEEDPEFLVSYQVPGIGT